MNYDLHNYKLRFNTTHTHNFRKGKPIKMNNWTAFQTKYKGHTIQVNPGCIMIWSKARYKTNDPILTSNKIILNMTKVAIDFCKTNKIKIYEIPIPIGKEVKVLDYKVNGNFITPNVKSVYPTPSPVEFTNPERGEQDAKEFVFNADKIAKVMTDFSRNIELHLKVEQRELEVAERTLQTLNDIKTIALKPSLLSRIKNFLKANTYK